MDKCELYDMENIDGYFSGVLYLYVENKRYVLSFGYDIELEILKLMNCMNPIYFTGETYTNEQLAYIYLYYKDLIIGEIKWHI